MSWRQSGIQRHRQLSKALNRLGICLKHAAALGLDVDLQATDKARALLGKQRHRPENVPALPWQEVPTFYQSLSDGSVTHLALRLLILTGVRSGPLRHLREEQIDGDVWTIPGEMMKGRRDATADFRVPLASEAQKVIDQARPLARNGFLFPSIRKGVISDATMSQTYGATANGRPATWLPLQPSGLDRRDD
jgi:integrase